MKILAILPRFPYPLEKGDKLRAYHLLKGLSSRHKVSVFALSDRTVTKSHYQAVDAFCEEVHVFHQRKWSIVLQVIHRWLKGWPLQMGYYYHPSAAKQLSKVVDTLQPDRLYFQLLRTAAYATEFTSYPKTLDYMDAFAAGMQRRAMQATPPLKWVWQSEYKRLRTWEEKVYPWFDQHTVITEQDAHLIHRPSDTPIQVISNGIDLDYFQRNPKAGKDIDILFAGNMSYAPNVQAARYIVEEILPLLLPQFPSLSVALVGTDPHPSVVHLAGPHVQVTGWVDDITHWYARAKIMLAPMQIGAGLQNKLLEAMAMGLPTITTPLAQQAMPGETTSFVGVAAQPDEFALRITPLLLDDSLREKYGRAGQAYVQEAHNWDKICAKLSRYIETT